LKRAWRMWKGKVKGIMAELGEKQEIEKWIRGCGRRRIEDEKEEEKKEKLKIEMC